MSILYLVAGKRTKLKLNFGRSPGDGAHGMPASFISPLGESIRGQTSRPTSGGSTSSSGSAIHPSGNFMADTGVPTTM